MEEPGGAADDGRVQAGTVREDSDDGASEEADEVRAELEQPPGAGAGAVAAVFLGVSDEVAVGVVADVAPGGVGAEAVACS